MIAAVRFLAFSGVKPIFAINARSNSTVVCIDHRGK